jgi:transketolase
MNDEQEQRIREKAEAIRVSIIDMLSTAKSGHTAGPLGMADIFATLYFHALRHDPQQPQWDERDLVVLSNGHICPVQYATMAHAGYFPVEELRTLRKLHSRLQGHPHREYLPGIEVSSGPLGSGFSQSVGMAIADRMKRGRGSQRYVYAFLGDGELDCGIVWEAAMLAGRERLQNLVAIVDKNGIQIDGFTWDVMPLEPLRQKWEAFNWHVIDVDGHNIRAIDEAIGQAKSVNDKPSVILAHTIPGKGVPAFERDFRWHGKPPNKEEAEAALRALHTFGGTINAEHH